MAMTHPFDTDAFYELTEDGKTVVKHGVTIIGNSELAADVPNHASQLFSKNLCDTKFYLLPPVGIHFGANHFDNVASQQTTEFTAFLQ